jgi:N-acetylglutamate synthase-like GNAT family acetyltransferase
LLRAARTGADELNAPIRNYVIVQENSKLIGCAAIDFHGSAVGVLTHVAVRKDMRHRGIGAALIQNRMALARARGIRTMALVTMYYHFNLYKRRGFRTCPRKDLPIELKNYWMFTAPQYMKCAVMYRALR